jgi:diguanylate cyclase (GGDEF)-like protein
VRDEHGVIGHFLSVGLDITELKRKEARAQRDPLTDLPLLPLLREQSLPMLALAMRRGHSVAVLYLDVDGMRAFNELHGRAAGDAVLRQVGDRLRLNLREGDSLARLEGTDEFVVLLSDVSDDEDAAQVARRLGEVVGRPMSIAGQNLSIAVTIGAVLCPQDADGFEELISMAAAAGGQARDGHSFLRFARPELNERAHERFSLEQDLVWAWERSQLLVHYQPIVTAAHLPAAGTKNRVCGATARVRWPHLERGLIESSDFEPLAERSGYREALDRWALTNTVRQLATWAQQGWVGWCVAGLSSSSLFAAHLDDFLRDLLRAHKVEPHQLALEIGSNALPDLGRSAGTLQRVQETGVKIVLAEVGLSRTILAELGRLPISVIKLEQQLVGEIGYDQDAEPALRALIALAHQRGAAVLADGVEDEVQEEWLRDAGCEYMQGPRFGIAQPGDSLFQVSAGPDR